MPLQIIRNDITKMSVDAILMLPILLFWAAAVWMAAFIALQVRSCWWNVKRSTAARPGAQKSRRATSCPANMSFTQLVRAGMTGGIVSANGLSHAIGLRSCWLRNTDASRLRSR